MRTKSLRSNAADSLLLTAVRIFTLLAGILSTMLLSHNLSLEEYGLYSQGNVIVSVVTSVSVLGLSDAINYFYNGSVTQRNQYVNTVFFVQLVAGGLFGVAIILCGPWLVRYFDNGKILLIIPAVAFRPLLDNLSNMFHVLCVSIGQARKTAMRNALFSITKIILICVVAYEFADIRILFWGLLVFELLCVAWFYYCFGKQAYWINPFAAQVRKISEILRFSMPMAVFVITKGLMKDLDKLVIGYFEGTAGMAVYANCSYALPFDIISNACLVVIMPIITRYIRKEDYKSAQGLFREYLRLGYMTTCMFASGVLLVAKETILVLFGDQYLHGEWVFVLYLVVDIIKFANLSLILSAKGWTKHLMVISVGSLLANGILNVVFYRLIGFAGPATASVAVSLFTTVLLCSYSGKALHNGFVDLIDKRELLLLVIQMIALSVPFVAVRQILRYLGIHPLLTVLAVGCTFVCIILITNRRRFLQILRNIDTYE